MEAQLIKICGAAILCVAVIVIMKELKAGIAWGVKIAGIVLIFGILAYGLGEAMEEFGVLWESVYISEYISVMLKAFGIALLVKICSDICKDCGEGSLAFGIESAGKLCVLCACIPMIIKIIECVKDIFALGEA